MPSRSLLPLQSSAPTPCPPGILSPVTQLTALAECPNCTAGYYCPYAATIDNPTACPAGSYCPEGSEQPSFRPAGYYCPAGSADKVALSRWHLPAKYTSHI